MDESAPPSPETDEPPTLAQVAAYAGVSPITVSRVVRLPALVAVPTRQRVEAAMLALGYVPNLVAGSLASARTRSVGVLVPTVANAIFADTIQGISDALEPLGYAVFLAQSRYDPDREDKMLAALLARRPEALIMVGSPATAAGARMLRRARIPVVETWDLPDDPIDAVAGFDNTKAGAVVARHFAASGRRLLGFLGGDDPRATRRWLGFQRVALEAGLDAPLRVVHARNAGAGVAAADGMRGLDAVFVANDALAIGLLSGLRHMGRRVPDDVAVIGLGDLETGRLINPALSTVRIDGETIGRTAAGLTISRDGPRRVDLGFELLTRETG
ncbi:LacI family DNA-binding transcriptional regulator [Acidisphaera sp. S103]|uniref:LacI family DNA-binding transcriptional regulator n=1 Tax=Acidisphaera sp. S103 TaxID=1747223 RepID=UPI00131A6A29|nr:LacI family DNA-binding transcriptional regulator [Acidisphaera sp. S103]